MAEIDFKYDVFISYSHKDKTWVRGTLLPKLKERGLKIWIDFENLPVGAPVLTTIEKALVASHKVCLIFTKDYLKSKWAEFENLLPQTNHPTNKEFQIIPVLLKKCDLPPRFSALYYVDFVNKDEFIDPWKQLFTALSKPIEENVEKSVGQLKRFIPQKQTKKKRILQPQKEQSNALSRASSSLNFRNDLDDIFIISQTRYLDCLDSARFSSKASYQNIRLLRLLYVKAQFILAIISGDIIIATENQVLDSKGFLDTFDDLLDAAKKLKLTDLPVRVAKQEKFVDIQQSVATNLSNVHENLKTGYTLSLWEELNTDSIRRLDWASAIGAHKKPASKDVHDSEKDMLNKLWITLEYFTNRYEKAEDASSEFESRLGKITRLNKNSLEQMKKQRFHKNFQISKQNVFTSSKECDSAKEIVTILRKIRKDIENHYKDGKINRTRLRDAIEQHNCDQDIKEGLNELVDGIYNQVLGIASNADIVQSSSFQEQKHSYIKAGYSLAAYVQETNKSPFKNMYIPWEFIEYDGLESAEKTDRDQLEKIVDNAPWIELLRLNENPSWKKSLIEYKRALSSLQKTDEALKGKNSRNSQNLEEHNTKQIELKKAWNTHIDNTKKLIPSRYWNLTNSRISFSIPKNSSDGSQPSFFISYSHFKTKRDMAKDEMYAKWQRNISLKGRMDAKSSAVSEDSD